MRRTFCLSLAIVSLVVCTSACSSSSSPEASDGGGTALPFTVRDAVFGAEEIDSNDSYQLLILSDHTGLCAELQAYAATPNETQVQFYFYPADGGSSAPGTGSYAIDVNATPGVNRATANYGDTNSTCSAYSPFFTATGGTVVLNTYNPVTDGGSAGTYTLEFPDAGTLQGSFNATYCALPHFVDGQPQCN